MGGGKGKKGLRPEDAALWAKVAQTMEERFADKPAPEDFRKMVEEALHGKPHKRPPAAKAKTPKPKARAVILPRQQPSAPGGGPGQLDRRSRQKMARGNVSIEARLDLHGMGAEMARSRLRSFITECRMRGMRTVLVITGKGASPFTRHTLHGHEHWHAPERQGRLRRLVPEWLHEHDFAHHVAGFQPAHPRHGGGGAFYIRLRRKDRGRAP